MRTLHFPSLAVAFAIAGCAADQSSSDPAAAPGGTMVIVAPGSGSSPTFPPHAVDAIARAIADNIYERLAEIGPELNTLGDAGFRPQLAQSWTWSADSLSIAFSLDPRARWHDGRPVRANDVAFTFAVLKDPQTGTGYTSLIGNIDSITVRDSLTAVAWFRSRTPEQFYDLAYQLFVIPEHVFGSIPRGQLATADAAMRPVGSNRFRFARFEPGVRYEIIADTAHYRGRPNLDRIVISFASDGGSAISQLMSGQADLLDVVPPDVIPRLDSAPGVRGYRYDGLLIAAFLMNNRDPRRLSSPHPILGDVRVRRALSMAVDREAMLRNVFDTLGILGSPGLPRPLADPAVKAPPFDRAAAAALLDSAGWRMGADSVRMRNGRPLALSVIVPTSSRPRMRYAVLIQEQLRTIGVRLTVDAMDFNAFLSRQNAGNFDAVMFSASPDPSRSSARQNWSTAGFPPRGQNYGRYSNPTFDALLDTALASFDPERLRTYYRRAFETFAADAPGIWLYDVLTVAGMHDRIRPGAMRADGWWTGLAEWSIPADERIERDRIGLRQPQQP